MFQALQQLMQSQMPQSQDSKGGTFSSQPTLAQLFGDPRKAMRQPLPQPIPPVPDSLQKMAPKFATQTFQGRDQMQKQIEDAKISPEDEMPFQAQGKRLIAAMQSLKNET